MTAHLSHFSAQAISAAVPRPRTGSLYPEGRFCVTVFRRPRRYQQVRAAFSRRAALDSVMAALTGATTREIMDRLGHTTTTAAMRYQHVAAGRADALADRLSLLATGGGESPRTPA
jgi:hypothetical protein